MTSEERRDALDRQLHAALSDFDAMLLEQQKALEQERSDEPLPPRGAGGSAAAGGGGAGSGAAGDTTGGSRDAGGLEGGEATPASVEGAPADGEVPPDVGDGRDDDVVARQLREAAMSEDDPELREKLWDEYRQYKKSAGKSGS